MDVTGAYQAAARIEEHAGVLRARAQLAAALAQSMAWHSLAATAFRERAHVTCVNTIALSSTMQALADTIRRRAVVLAQLP